MALNGSIFIPIPIPISSWAFSEGGEPIIPILKRPLSSEVPDTILPSQPRLLGDIDIDDVAEDSIPSTPKLTMIAPEEEEVSVDFDPESKGESTSDEDLKLR